MAILKKVAGFQEAPPTPSTSYHNMGQKAGALKFSQGDLWGLIPKPSYCCGPSRLLPRGQSALAPGSQG